MIEMMVTMRKETDGIIVFKRDGYGIFSGARGGGEGLG